MIYTFANYLSIENTWTSTTVPTSAKNAVVRRSRASPILAVYSGTSAKSTVSTGAPKPHACALIVTVSGVLALDFPVEKISLSILDECTEVLGT